MKKTKTETKIEELQTTITNHEAVIETYKIQLNEVKYNHDPYGVTKKWWLKSMRACTTPFAAYNKNINSYLDDPDLHNHPLDL